MKPFDDFERQSLKAQIGRLQQKVRLLREEIAKLKADNARLSQDKAHLYSLTERPYLPLEDFIDLKRQLDDAYEETKVERQRGDALREQLEQATRELEAERARAKTLLSSGIAVSENFSAERRKVATLEESRDYWIDQWEELTDENLELRTELESEREKVADLHCDLEHYEKCQDEIAALRRQVEVGHHLLGLADHSDPSRYLISLILKAYAALSPTEQSSAVEESK